MAEGRRKSGVRRHPPGRHDDHLPAGPQNRLGQVVDHVPDLGIGESLLAQGYGLSYARAMESFRKGPSRSKT